MLKFCLLTIVFMVGVSAHGKLSEPKPRTSRRNDGGVGPVARVRDGPLSRGEQKDLVCRGMPRGRPSAVVTAGETLELKFDMIAPHPGDCALYVSYDDDSKRDEDKDWALIWTKKDCLCFEQNGRCEFGPGIIAPQDKEFDVEIPEWLPAQEQGAILRFEWYATHFKTSRRTVELYSNCFDASVVGSPKSLQIGQLENLVKVTGDHLPTSPDGFRGNTFAEIEDVDSFPQSSFPALLEDIALDEIADIDFNEEDVDDYIDDLGLDEELDDFGDDFDFDNNDDDIGIDIDIDEEEEIDDEDEDENEDDDDDKKQKLKNKLAQIKKRKLAKKAELLQAKRDRLEKVSRAAIEKIQNVREKVQKRKELKAKLKEEKKQDVIGRILKAKEAKKAKKAQEDNEDASGRKGGLRRKRRNKARVSELVDGISFDDVCDAGEFKCLEAENCEALPECSMCRSASGNMICAYTPAQPCTDSYNRLNGPSCPSHVTGGEQLQTAGGEAEVNTAGVARPPTFKVMASLIMGLLVFICNY